MSFENKVILITGAGSGIGAGAAKYFARSKGAVALVDINEVGLNQTADEIKSEGGKPPLVIVADVTKDAERIIDETINHFGRLDVLINNVGIAKLHDINNFTLELFDQTFDVNVRSIVYLTKLAIPYLEKTKGNIVNTSSLAGIRPEKGNLSYSMSKAALDQFTKCAALELAPQGIRINSVNPGHIRTPIYKTTGMDDAAIEQYLLEKSKLYPFGKVGEIEDVVQAMAYLAAESNGFVTGHQLVVDGGLGV